jgi:hypothetical protein
LIFAAVAFGADGVGIGVEVSYPSQYSQPKFGPNGAFVPPVPMRFETRSVGTVLQPQQVTVAPAKPPEIVVAADRGDSPVVKALLEKGAGVNAATMEGATALMAAAARGRADIVQLLLDRQADVNAVTSDGKTALAYAANNGQTKVVQLLLAHKADPKVLDNAGKMAVDYATANKHADIVKLLTPNRAP